MPTQSQVRLPSLVLVAAIGVFGAGCAEGPTPRPDRDEAPAPAEARPGVRLDRLLAAGGDAAPVLGAMRAPRWRQARAVANAHVGGQIDSVVVWGYDGLTLETVAVTGGPTFVRRVVVTEGTYGTSDGLSVGETRADLETSLGSARAETPGGTRYLVDTGEMPVAVDVVYALDGDGVERATEIAWHLPVD